MKTKLYMKELTATKIFSFAFFEDFARVTANDPCVRYVVECAADYTVEEDATGYPIDFVMSRSIY